jgi:hypothetical protein
MTDDFPKNFRQRQDSKSDSMRGMFFSADQAPVSLEALMDL